MGSTMSHMQAVLARMREAGHKVQLARIYPTQELTGLSADFLIVDDTLQPVTPQPIEETTMLESNSSKGRLSNLISLVAAMSHMTLPSYSLHPQLENTGIFSTCNFKRVKADMKLKGGSHKQNLRASKRGGKSHKVRKCCKR